MMTCPLYILTALLLAAISVGAQDGNSTRELVCFNGYVMDTFCINRGTLLDAPSLSTLVYPDRHSVHCLVDISSCRRDGYEMLLDPAPGSTDSMHGRVFYLDDVGNDMVINLARTVGRRCSSCFGGGTVEEGFRATAIGYRHEGPAPQLLEVVELRLDDQPCTDEEGGQYVPLNVTFEMGAGTSVNPVAVHGGMMIAAWGILVPVAVLSSLLLRHHGDGPWFNIHRACNIIAVILTAIGVVYAFIKFGNILTSESAKPSYRHASLGMTTFVCAVVQVALGFFRPHLPEKDVEGAARSQKTVARRAFEVVHKSLGYITVTLAYTTMYFGAEISGNQDTFFGVWYAVLAFAAVVALWMLYNKWDHLRKNPSATKKLASGKYDERMERPVKQEAGDSEQSTSPTA